MIPQRKPPGYQGGGSVTTVPNTKPVTSKPSNPGGSKPSVSGDGLSGVEPAPSRPFTPSVWRPKKPGGWGGTLGHLGGS